jgi:hypothetical protein
VCARLDRPAIGIDLNRRAVTIATRRLAALSREPRVERVVDLDRPVTSRVPVALGKAG